MVGDELPYDSLAERGQYRAFQRAYGKENQAMLGLILLTVAWSYAAHVYGHGTVFIWFTRYVLGGVAVVALYHFLQYAHLVTEFFMNKYHAKQKTQQDALREIKAKEKAKERRKRSKEFESMKPKGNKEVQEEQEDEEVVEEREQESQRKVESEAVMLAKALKEKEKREKERKAKEKERQAREVEEAKERYAAELAVARKISADKEHLEAKKELKLRAEEAAAAAAAAALAAEAEALARIQEEEASLKERIQEEEASRRIQEEEASRKEGSEPMFIHPDQSAHIAAVMGNGPIVPPEILENDVAILQKTAEDAVAAAKKQAQRAQQQLARAEKKAQQVKRSITQDVRQNGPTAVTKPASTSKPTEVRDRAPSRNDAVPRDSLKELLRGHSTPDGGGYVPPHMRDGYTPKPNKAVMPPVGPRSTTDVRPKKSNAGKYPPPGRAGKVSPTSKSPSPTSTKSPSESKPLETSRTAPADGEWATVQPKARSKKKQASALSNPFDMLQHDSD